MSDTEFIFWYFFSFIFFGIFFLFYNKSKSTLLVKLMIIFLFTTILSLPFIQRDLYLLNNDFPIYLNEFNGLKNFEDMFKSKLSFKADYLFFTPQVISNKLNISASYYFDILLFISIFLLLISYSKQVPIKYLAIICLCILSSSFFYLLLGNVLRQGLLLFIVVSVIFSNKLAPLFAGLWIHKTAIFLVAARLKFSYVVLVPIISILFGYFLPPILESLPVFGTKFSFYLSVFSRASQNGVLKMILLICYILFILFTGWYKEPIHKRIFILASAILVFWKIDPVFSRLIYFVDVFIPFSIARILMYSAKEREVTLLLALIPVILVYGLYVISHPSIKFNMGL